MLALNTYERELYNTWVKDTEARRMGVKTTVVLVTLLNGYEVVGTSACINPDDFNFSIGVHYALVDALRKVDEFTGILTQHAVYEAGLIAQVQALQFAAPYPTEELTEEVKFAAETEELDETGFVTPANNLPKRVMEHRLANNVPLEGTGHILKFHGGEALVTDTIEEFEPTEELEPEVLEPEPYTTNE